MINNNCCVNGRLPVVRYRTITTRTEYCTVCTLHRITLSRSILYYMEIVGNCQNSASWSVPKLFTIIYKNSFDKIIVFQIDFYNFNHVIFIPPDQKAGGMLTFTFLEITVILDRRVQSPCQQKFFDHCPKIITFPSNFLYFLR